VGHTGPSAPSIRAPACRQAGRIGDGEVIEERFVHPLAGLLSRRVGRCAELGWCGGEAQVIEDVDFPTQRLLSRESQSALVKD